MRFISPFLKRALYPGMSNLGMFRKSALPGGCCVVTYHGVLPARYESKDAALDGSLVSAANLRAQLRLLKLHYHVLHPDEFRSYLKNETALPARSVLLTCDDGLQNVLSEMLPVLQESGLTCLFFPTGASAGDGACMLWYEELYLTLTAASGTVRIPELKLSAELQSPQQRRALWWTWVRELSRLPRAARQRAVSEVSAQAGVGGGEMRRDRPNGRRFLLMTSDGIRQLVRAGMAVGAHSMSHPYLPNAADEDAWSEIQESRAALTAVAGKEVWALAYPFGDSSSAAAREFRIAEQAGFECAFMNCGGGFQSSFQRFAIPRVHVTADMTLGEFEAHISGFHEKLRQRFSRQGVAPCA